MPREEQVHQALYRKYRPQTFDDVCGQEHVTSVLRYEASHGKVSHAYLFCGSRGTGKTTCAKILAKAVNCLSPVNGSPCGECFACRSIDEGSATDVVEMDAASNNGVDYIRDIREAVNYTPTALKMRVYIIDEVHMLSVSAFNALLKTLEEPPEHVLFILATTELHKLPATIISRCQRFDFRRLKVDVLADRLMYIAGKEQIPLDPDAAKLISKQAMGGMRDAISLFELCASGGNAVTVSRVTEILGLSGTETAYKTAVAVKRRDMASLFRMVQTVVSSSKDISVFWQELIEFWRDMLVCKILPPAERADYLDFTDPELRVLDDAAKRFTEAMLTYHVTVLDGAMREMSRSPQTKRLTAEVALLRMCDPSLEATTEALTARMTELETKVALLEGGNFPAAPKKEAAEQGNVPLTDTVSAGDSSEPVAMEPSPAKTEAAVLPKADDADGEGWDLLSDTGEISEKIAAANPMYMSFFRDADCYISRDRKKVTVKTTSKFASQMLSADGAKKVILSAFLLCGACDSDAVLTIEAGAVPKEKNPVDELLSDGLI